MVFQSFALFPWLTVQQNVELGLEAQRTPAAERERRAEEAIDLIGLGGFERAYPEGAVGRHAPAGRLRPRARRASRAAVDGRAVLGPRRADRRDDAHRHHRPLDRGPPADPLDPDGDPQHRGGGADERPHPDPVVQPRPDHGRDQDHPAPPAQPRRPALPPAGRRHLRPHDRAHARRPRRQGRRRFPGRRGRHGAAAGLDGRAGRPDGDAVGLIRTAAPTCRRWPRS